MGMELISAVMRTMPVATFVGDNSTGSWFSDIIETGAKYLAPILQAAPHPIMKGIGTAISAGHTMMSAWNKKPAAERNAINQRAQSFAQNVGKRGKKPKNAKGPARQGKSTPKKAKKLPDLIRGTPKGMRWQKASLKPGSKQNVSMWIPSRKEQLEGALSG